MIIVAAFVGMVMLVLIGMAIGAMMVRVFIGMAIIAMMMSVIIKVLGLFPKGVHSTGCHSQCTE
jgi:hypothetical protein